MSYNLRQKLITTSTLFCLFFITAAAAETPHVVEADKCPDGQICCPTEVYCAYGVENSCGDSTTWIPNGDPHTEFKGVINLKLFHAGAALLSKEDQTYTIYCQYGEPNNYFALNDNDPQKLQGKWSYSSDGEDATCKVEDVNECSGIPVNS